MNTKRTAIVFVCACMVLTFIAGCKLPTTQHVTTLQGTIFNAITGERIGGKDLQMYLEQGTITRKPDLFYTGVKSLGKDNTTIDLMGDYAFANIPSLDDQSTTITDPNPNEYRVTVVKEGFQKFEGIIDSDMLANMDNVVKNIYLFPENYLIPCYTYTATFNGKPVTGVTITAAPYATLNPGILATDKWLSIDINGVLDEAGYPYTIIGSVFNIFTLFNNNYFFPAPGYLASTIQKTDANGQVSLCDLAAGGAYAVCTSDVNFENVDLLPQCKLLVAGYSSPDQVFKLGTAQYTGNEYGLYVKSISNSVDDQITSAGTLTIKFNRAVELGDVAVSPPFPTEDFGAYLGLASAAVWPAAPASYVTATLSSDGLTLTLTPAWTTAPNLTTELGQDITYTDNNAFLIVKGYADSKILLSSLVDASGSNISLTVHLSAE